MALDTLGARLRGKAERLIRGREKKARKKLCGFLFFLGKTFAVVCLYIFLQV